MLKPTEFQTTKPTTLPNGDTVSNADVWEMLSAARDGNLETIKELTKRSPGLVTCEFNYTPPIHFAVREGHLEVTRFLLEHGADPSSYRSYPFQDTLLTFARDREHDDVAELLLEYLSRRAPVVEGLEEFFKACRNGDLAKVKAQLDSNLELARAADDTGDTALHQAVDGNQVEVVNALLDAGANPDAKRSNGIRPINLALRRNNRPLAETLIARGAEYNIYIAAVFGDTDYVRTALANDSSLANFEDSAHVHPLSAAADRKDLELVKLLLAHGADPSLPEEGAPLGQPLWTAVYTKQHEMAKLLLEHGANPNTAPESSGPALLHARGDAELTKLLLDHGAVDSTSEIREFQLMVGDNDLAKVEEVLKRSPELLRDQSAFWSEGILSGPANGNRREMIELLMKYGARVPDASKWGPYYYFKHYETAKLLLERGMNPNHTNWHHVNLLHYMAQQGDVAKATLLLDHGADIDAVDEEYCSTPLGFAARWGQKELVKLLIERGADVNNAGASWAKPLVWAKKKGHREVEEILLGAG
jgi:ankyrin repeat protein